jgi:hypothetical protein
MTGPTQFINAMLQLTILLVSCLLEDLSEDVFHDSTAGDTAVRSGKAKNKNAKDDKGIQNGYMSKLAESSERKSIAVSKVCGLETEKNMESMLYTARDRKRSLQRDLADDYKDEGGRRHVKQLKSDFSRFRHALDKVAFATKSIEKWKALNEESADGDESSTNSSTEEDKEQEPERDELRDLKNELAAANSAEDCQLSFSQESILDELAELDDKIDNYKKRLLQYSMEAEKEESSSSD